MFFVKIFSGVNMKQYRLYTGVIVVIYLILQRYKARFTAWEKNVTKERWENVR